MPAIERLLVSIETVLERRGFTLRRPTLGDIPALHGLQAKAFPGIRPAQMAGDLQLYRLIEFGDARVLCAVDDEIVGYQFMVLTKDPGHTAVTGALALLGDLQGRGLGPLMSRHAIWRALAGGARILQGTVEPTNIPSLAMILNKCHSTCDRFHLAMGVSRMHRLSFICPLEPQRLARSPLDVGKLAAWAAQAREGADFRLLRPGDLEGLDAMYREARMRVAAVIPGGLLSADKALFAMPFDVFESIRPDLDLDGLP